MKKRRDTTPGWGCGGVMTIRPTESQRLIREISSLEVDTSKKRKRTPTKIFSPTDKDMVMDRKLRKRRKTTEGPFSENIEKKRKKVGEKQRKDLILRKWKKKKKEKTRKSGSHLRVA